MFDCIKLSSCQLSWLVDSLLDIYFIDCLDVFLVSFVLIYREAMEVDGSAGTDINISPERFILIVDYIVAAHNFSFHFCQVIAVHFEFKMFKYGGSFVHNACRLEAFSAALGKHRHSQHVEQISVADIEGVVNIGAPVPYSKAEILTLLEVIFLLVDYNNYLLFYIYIYTHEL